MIIKELQVDFNCLKCEQTKIDCETSVKNQVTQLEQHNTQLIEDLRKLKKKFDERE